ncbi:MAG: hypothetical protein ACLP1W_18975 [Rhodomicrobium sp.]
MSASPAIDWIIAISGAITAAGGLTALIFPHQFLRLVFSVKYEDASTLFFVRHWGVLIFAIGALIVAGAYAPAVRAPVLAAASMEKLAVFLLIFFGPAKRTMAMTAIAITDGVFAVLYVAYLAWL